MGLAFSYDDNALLGRRGQFLDSAVAGPGGGGRVADVAVRPSVRVQLKRGFRERDEAVVAARSSLSLLRSVSDLRGYDLRSSASYAIALGELGQVEPALEGAYHREQAEWSHRALRPRLAARYLFDSGLATELNYGYALRQFARHGSGAPQPKNSYASIDVRSHSAEVALRMWHGPRFRSQLTADFQAARYEGNLTTNLEDYSRLHKGAERNDLGGGATLSLLVLALPNLSLAPGVRYDSNRSNSDPFTYWAAHALLDGVLTLWPGHALYVQLAYARFDFPRERFDRRYENTRLDFRREIKAAYRFKPREGLTLEFAYLGIGSASNDCTAFSPERDELGLPVYSRSYSCFDQNRAELALSYEL